MKTITFLSKITVFMLASLTIAIAAPAIQPLNSIAAKVNNQIITQTQLDNQVSIAEQQLKAANQPMPAASVLRKQVLDQLIDQNLILQVAQKNGITVSPAQLQEAIAVIAKQNHLTVDQLRQQVKQQGISYSDYKEQMKDQILINAAARQEIGNTIHITDADVETAMKKIAALTKAIPEYHLQIMLVPIANAATPQQQQAAQKQANDLFKQLQQGTGFKLLADASLATNNPVQSADMGWRQLSQLPPSIAGQVASAISGSILGPISTAKGYYIIKVAAIRTLKSTPGGTAAQKRQVKQMLYMQKFAQDTKAWAQKLRSTAYVQIMSQ